MKTCADYGVNDEAIKNMNVCLSIDFPANGMFEAINNARSYLADRGFSFGSMEMDRPIGIHHGDCYISKWHNMTAKERRSLNGVIVPIGEFREGGARVLFFITINEVVKQ